MQVVVNDLLTSYERCGSQPDAADISGQRRTSLPRKILILHGWGDNAKGWAETCARLSDEYDVVTVDLPGFGGTAMPPVAWGLSDYAAFVAEFLRKIDFQPYAIIGHSNGGAITVRGLAEGILQADKLVLLASAGIRNETHGRRSFLRVLTKAGKVVTYPLPARVRKRLRSHLYTTIGSDLLIAEHMQETFKRIVTDDIQADAARLSLPTLLVYGEDDTAAPVQYGRILHNLISGSTLETIGDAGHFIHLDKPDVVIGMVRKFLA